MTKELKPCPFCGGKARLDNRFNWWWVACTSGRKICKVNASTIQFDSPDEAVEVWNRRAEPKTIINNGEITINM